MNKRVLAEIQERFKKEILDIDIELRKNKREINRLASRQWELKKIRHELHKIMHEIYLKQK